MAISSSKRIIVVYVAGVLVFFLVTNTPVSIPCLFLWATGIPCPACGITRAFVLLSQFEIINAARMNILAVPFAVCASIYFFCAVADAFFHRNAIQRFNLFFAKKWVIALAAGLMLVSWWYNLVRWYF